jgi:hypothetical protein
MTPLELRTRRRVRAAPRKLRPGEWAAVPPGIFGPPDRIFWFMLLGPLVVAVGFIVWVLWGWL